MSNDGSKPPSIAPKKPARPKGAGASSGASAPGSAGEQVAPRPASGPVSGSSAPSASAGTSTGRTPSEATGSGAGNDGGGPSLGDRFRQAAKSAADSARGALPSGSGDGESARAEAGRPDAARSEETRPAPRTSTATYQRVETETETEAPAGGPRRVRLAVSKVDPWSVMKLSFLLSVAIGIMIVVASAVTWYTLDGLQVFTSVNDTIAEITGSPDFFNLLEYAAFDRVISLAVLIAVVDVVLLTALSTIGAFLYNIVAALVGGIHLTLTDD